MSGHSHWSTIKHKKELADKQRGKIFSKLSRLITIAARKGDDPDQNTELREAIERAKEANMPNSNIERAIKRGVGELKGKELEEVLFEAYGEGGVAIIIEGITDNKNRTFAEIKQILNQHSGKLADQGSVRWMFERKGIILIDSEEQAATNKEEIELNIIEAGAEDIVWRDDMLEIYTSIDDLENVKDKLKKQGIKIESSTLGWMAKKEIEVSQKKKQAIEKLFQDLDENDSVQEIYSNLKI